MKKANEIIISFADLLYLIMTVITPEELSNHPYQLLIAI